MIEMMVQGLSTEPRTNATIRWLRERRGDIVLPLLIEDTEALSIYTTLAHCPRVRPLAHDLIKSILEHFHASVAEADLTELRDGLLHAEIVLESAQGSYHLPAQPYDAIALALRSGAPIYLSETVLSQGKTGPVQTSGGLSSRDRGGACW